MLKIPASVAITFDEENLNIDGVRVSLTLIPQILYELAHPNPRKWYRLERIDDAVIIHVKISEEEPNGTPIASTADARRREEDSGRQGPEATGA